MRNRFQRKALEWFLIFFALCMLPFAFASSPEILGQIVRSQGASLGGSLVPNEGSIIAGDLLETTETGSALLRFGSRAEIVLGASTRVTFNGEPGKLAANLAAGAMTVETLGATPFITVTPNCKVEPSGQSPATYGVSFIPGHGTAVQTKIGTVRVTTLQPASTRLVTPGREALVADNTSNASPIAGQQEQGKPSPSLPAGPAQPASTGQAIPAPSSASTPQEGGKPAPSQAAGPSMPATVPHHGSGGVVLLVVGVAGAAGAALAASGGGSGPASPSVP